MTTERSTLRERYLNRRIAESRSTLLEVPSAGEIDADLVQAIQQLAVMAANGDVVSRDDLYSCLKPRFHCIGNFLHPWPNTPAMIGIWDHDDVNQEGWIIFTELLEAWDGDVPFVNFLLARFSWRLRDRILRGIGKPLPPIGTTRVPEMWLADSVYASDDEQPESALMASKLLEALLRQRLGEDAATAGESEILTALHSPRRKGELESLTSRLRDEPSNRSKIA